MKEIQHTHAAQQLWVVCRPALAHGDRTAKGCFLFRSTGILNTGRLLLSSTPHRDLDEVYPKIPNLLLPFTNLNTQQTHWRWNFPSVEIMILASSHSPTLPSTRHHGTTPPKRAREQARRRKSWRYSDEKLLRPQRRPAHHFLTNNETQLKGLRARRFDSSVVGSNAELCNGSSSSAIQMGQG